MHTNPQKFAQIAFRQIDEIKDKDKSYRDKYGTMSHKLPLLIRTAGLAQALAFVQAKKESAYGDLLNHLAEAIEWPDITSGDKLAEKSRGGHLDDYILLTRRVTAALIWYKRFSESILDVKNTDGTPEGDD